jgi:hypothetical protein
MNAATVASKLKIAGIPVISVSECKDEEDGAVQITKRLHVQVCSFGSGANLVREEGEGDDHGFFFFQRRKAMKKLIEDINQAMADEA